ncbi:MAG: hypothetical protein COB30_002355 [Ectothiorhodospiraceae bacterium]|nr:hypothetical protein [Ectothiorhodospiraceae bacterium]
MPAIPKGEIKPGRKFWGIYQSHTSEISFVEKVYLSHISTILDSLAYHLDFSFLSFATPLMPSGLYKNVESKVVGVVLVIEILKNIHFGELELFIIFTCFPNFVN